MTDVYIVECVRTPIAKGREGGLLSRIHPVDLLAIVLEEVTRRAKVPPSEVEDVICGCVSAIKEQGANIARLSLLKAGYPEHVPGVTLNRMCGSSQQAIHFASQAIASLDSDIIVACGIEMMSTVKMGSDSNLLSKGLPENYTKFNPNNTFPKRIIHQGSSAEILANKYKISREQVDQFAILSHQKAFNATKNNYFSSQIVPITITIENKENPSEKKTIVVNKDEGIRYPVDLATLGKLPTVFKKEGGVVTAGNASQISDGASAVLLASEKKIKELGLKKRARIITRVVVGSDPVPMLEGIIPATKKALEKANLKIEDIDVFEVNEAFATVVLSWTKALNVPMEKVNPNGGAIAHGHPLGATGCVLMTKLVNELERSNKRYGLQTMCIGIGQATCTIIENCSWNQNSKSKL